MLLRCLQTWCGTMTTSAQASSADIRRLLNIVILDADEVLQFSTRELDLALRLTRRVRLLGRLGENLRSAGLLRSLPPEAADQLISGMAMANARARLALWELDRIERAMRPDNLTPLVAMKGCTYLLLDLPNAHGRVFADVDLMTTEAELEGLEERLNSNGWLSSELTPYDQNYYRKWTHELPPLMHAEREVEIDLHHNIMPRTARLNPCARRLLERSRQLSGSRYRVFSDEDIVLHAMSHLMFDGDLGDKLRDLVDVHDLVTYFSKADPAFWQLLIERAEELDLTRPAFYSLHFSHTLLKLPIPSKALAAIQPWSPPRPVRWIMDRLVPRALYPLHPDKPSRVSSLCRLLLYMRSHWIRMPPWLLVYHLSHKFVAKRLPT